MGTGAQCVSACMCACVQVYVGTSVCVSLHVCVSGCEHMSVHAYMCACMRASACVCACVHVCVCCREANAFVELCKDSSDDAKRVEAALRAKPGLIRAKNSCMRSLHRHLATAHAHTQTHRKRDAHARTRGTPILHTCVPSHTRVHAWNPTRRTHSQTPHQLETRMT